MQDEATPCSSLVPMKVQYQGVQNKAIINHFSTEKMDRLCKNSQIPVRPDPASRPQIHAIEKIATIKKWDPVECCRRILHSPDMTSLDQLNKDQASTVIGRMKEVA